MKIVPVKSKYILKTENVRMSDEKHAGPKTAEMWSKIEKVKKFKKLLTFWGKWVTLSKQSRLTETQSEAMGS